MHFGVGSSNWPRTTWNFRNGGTRWGNHQWNSLIHRVLAGLQLRSSLFFASSHPGVASVPIGQVSIDAGEHGSSACETKQCDSDAGTSDAGTLDGGFGPYDGGQGDAGKPDSGTSWSLGPPFGVSATGGNGIVELKWSSPPGALDFIVQRYSDGGPSTIGQTNSPTFTDSSVINESEYTYTITARNDGGSSPQSDPVGATASAYYSWTLRSSSQAATAAAYGNGKCIVVGAGGLASISSDCVSNWILSDTHVGLPKGVAAGGGAYVIIEAGSAQRSSDGVHWESAQVSGSSTLEDIAYGAGVFVAVSSTGIFTSPDGLGWTQIPTAGAGCEGTY